MTWQGWLTVILFLAAILSGAAFIEDTPDDTLSRGTLIYMAYVAAAAALLIIISVKKGPSPKWRWGSKPTDNPDEDF